MSLIPRKTHLDEVALAKQRLRDLGHTAGGKRSAVRRNLGPVLVGSFIVGLLMGRPAVLRNASKVAAAIASRRAVATIMSHFFPPG